jgi:hypothetical protein
LDYLVRASQIGWNGIIYSICIIVDEKNGGQGISDFCYLDDTWFNVFDG